MECPYRKCGGSLLPEYNERMEVILKCILCGYIPVKVTEYSTHLSLPIGVRG